MGDYREGVTMQDAGPNGDDIDYEARDRSRYRKAHARECNIVIRSDCLSMAHRIGSDPWDEADVGGDIQKLLLTMVNWIEELREESPHVPDV